MNNFYFYVTLAHTTNIHRGSNNNKFSTVERRMDFASSHVYAYDNSDEECISDEELEYGMSARLVL